MKNSHQPLKLWYKASAGNDWNRALPLGNGRLGAMIFGEISQERIQLNEDTVWSGGPRDRINPDALKSLPEIRRLVLAGKLSEAERLTEQALSGVPDSQHQYEPLADLFISFDHPELIPRRTAQEISQAATGMSQTIEGATGYHRELDLTTATATVEYTIGGVRFRRDHLASAADNVIAIRLTASSPGSINLKLRLQRGPHEIYSARFADTITQVDGHALLMKGRTSGEGSIHFAACLGASVRGGKLLLRGESLLVEQADEVLLVLGADTSFREENPAQASTSRMEKALSLGWEGLKERHLREYRGWFDRVSLELGPKGTDVEEASALPTDERLQRLIQNGNDPGLFSLYFQFGRYLLISCSRPGSMAANLQGIWNQDFFPSWGSKYTININTQMNYWPAEVGNLAELHEPLFDLLERVRKKGRDVARQMYGCRGFVIHHNTDLWADACPTDRCLTASYWLMGGAWLSLHLWEHYAYSGDDEFLQRAYDTLKEASLFFIDFLIEDPAGRLVTCPSVSPENVYVLPGGEIGTLCAGCSMDHQIIDQLFRSCEEAVRILGVDEEFGALLKATHLRLPPPSIGKHGQLMEWPDDYDEIEPGHRHISHLFALHPGNLISPLTTPELAAAARVTLERRLSHGGASTGWSRAWVINFWARLLDGEMAFENLSALLTKSTLPNLFDNHPPFQIDGNFGGTAAIAEMLVQSHQKVTLTSGLSVYDIHLLPALPTNWPSGHARGLRARGGFEIEMEWSKGKLTVAILQSTKGGSCLLRYGSSAREVTLKPGKSQDFRPDDNLK